jgi:hypothetical protein
MERGVSFHPDVLHGWRVSSLGANLLIFLGLHSHCFRLVLAHMYLNTYIVFMYIYIYPISVVFLHALAPRALLKKALPQACRMVESFNRQFVQSSREFYSPLIKTMFSPLEFAIHHGDMGLSRAKKTSVSW